MDEHSNPYYSVKYFCCHCKTTTEKRISLPAPFVPQTVICLTCGLTLEGHRRLITSNGESELWVEYR